MRQSFTGASPRRPRGPLDPVPGEALRQGLHGPCKCAFGRAQLGFLGHRVSAVGLAMDPRKVTAVRDWPVPP